MQAIEIAVNYDFICPWCWVGHLNLISGIRAANLPVPVSIEYVPFELNPTMPLEGMDRREHRPLKPDSPTEGFNTCRLSNPLPTTAAAQSS